MRSTGDRVGSESKRVLCVCYTHVGLEGGLYSGRTRPDGISRDPDSGLGLRSGSCFIYKLI